MGMAQDDRQWGNVFKGEEDELQNSRVDASGDKDNNVIKRSFSPCSSPTRL
jgi:hypothetical protein